LGWRRIVVESIDWEDIEEIYGKGNEEPIEEEDDD